MKIKNWFLVMALSCFVPFAMADDKYSTVDEYDSIVLPFAEGSHRLSDKHGEMLREFVQKAQARGSISKIEIAAWSDKDHPMTGDLSKANRELADKRLQTVKNVLRKDIGKMKVVGLYNMAESANWVGRFFHTSEAELDAVFAKKATGDLERQDFVIFKREGAPSKAVVVLKVRKK